MWIGTTSRHNKTSVLVRLAISGVIWSTAAVTVKPTQALADTAAAFTGGDKLEEVVVTSEKRSERLIDTPQSVSVLSAEQLSQLGATQLRDFVDTVPGLSITTQGAGYTQITMRGVTTGYNVGPTVGIYIDEVPYGSSTVFGGSALYTIDPALVGLDRIEVLRGPQGTLYGSSTMGGLVKYVTRTPDTLAFSGEAQAGLSGTEHGTVNYTIAGAVNEPVIRDELALRVSAFQVRDGGFIDNAASDRRDVNRANTYGGRVDLLLTPSDGLSVRLNAFVQNISRDGDGTVDYTYSGTPLYGPLAQYRRVAEPFEQHFRLVSGTVSYDTNLATLTSISSYQSGTTDVTLDVSPVYVPLLNTFAGPFGAVATEYRSSVEKFTQEVRLASKVKGPLEWLVGAFYTHETSNNGAAFLLYDTADLPLTNNVFSYSTPSIYREYAAFGDLTWQVTNKLDLIGGVRYAHNDQSETQFGAGLIGLSHPQITSSDHVFTYLGDARYHFGEYATGYLRYATGYRPGGPNLVTSATDSATFAPDTLKSYEAGFKAESFDHRLSVDLAGYYVDWSNMQVEYVNNGFGSYTNASGGAGINGAELSLTARPASALTLSSGFAFQHAYLKEDEPKLGGVSGERLPNVPRFTGSVNGDYVFRNLPWQPAIGASVRYIGNRDASFDNATGYLQYYLPAYTTVDLRSSIAFSPFTLQLYVHNLSNRLGEISALNWRGPAMPAIQQPRTIGLTAVTKF